MLEFLPGRVSFPRTYHRIHRRASLESIDAIEKDNTVNGDFKTTVLVVERGAKFHSDKSQHSGPHLAASEADVKMLDFLVRKHEEQAGELRIEIAYPGEESCCGRFLKLCTVTRSP